jgi:hypothetical protein
MGRVNKRKARKAGRRPGTANSLGFETRRDIAYIIVLL